MKTFIEEHPDHLAFFGTRGWDGYCAEPVSPTTYASVEKVWQAYNLWSREYTVECDTLGQVLFKVKTVHGTLELNVLNECYWAYIEKDGYVILDTAARYL